MKANTTKLVITTPDEKQTVIDLLLDGSGFNCLLHDQGIGVDLPEFLEVNPHDTIDCMKQMTEGEWKWISEGDIFKMLWEKAFDHQRSAKGGRQPLLTIPKTVAALNKMDMGMIHMAGMIVLGCEGCFAGKNVFFRNPETYLHPATERYIVGMLQEMLKLAGHGNGKVTATKEAPKKLIKQEKKNKVPPVDPNLDPVTVKVLVLKWLSCMTQTKKIVKKNNGSLLTVAEVIPEVEQETEIGKMIIKTFMNYSANGENWAH